MVSTASKSKGENPLDMSLERNLDIDPVSSQSAVDGVMVARQSTSKEENPLDLSLERKLEVEPGSKMIQSQALLYLMLVTASASISGFLLCLERASLVPWTSLENSQPFMKAVVLINRSRSL